MVQEANAEYLAANRIAMINDAASLIADMQVKQNLKIVYDSNNLYRVTYIKKTSDDVTGLCKKFSNKRILIYRNNVIDAGKVTVTKLVLCFPRMVFNSDGLNFVQNNHTQT